MGISRVLLHHDFIHKEPCLPAGSRMPRWADPLVRSVHTDVPGRNGGPPVNTVTPNQVATVWVVRDLERPERYKACPIIRYRDLNLLRKEDPESPILKKTGLDAVNGGDGFQIEGCIQIISLKPLPLDVVRFTAENPVGQCVDA